MNSRAFAGSYVLNVPPSLTHSLSLTHPVHCCVRCSTARMQPSVTVIGGMSVWVRSVVGGWG